MLIAGPAVALVLVWLLMAAYTAHVAGSRGRPRVPWFALGVLLGPLALLAALLAPKENA